MRATSLSRLLLAGVLLTGTARAGMADGASKFLGNITTNGAVRSDFGTYWNQITAENECKWGSIEYNRGVYDFKGCNDAYTWAKKNGARFKFHALVWGSQYPTWLKGLNAADTKIAITAWYDAVKKQFPDLEMIDVVNEAIRTGTNQYHSGYTDTKIIEALGGDNNGDYAFVTTAFKMARERWPKAVLVYNDYNTFQWQRKEGIDLIKKIRAAGAPVDAYGQQAHDLTDMSLASFKAALKEIHDGVGIPLYITEYDIGTKDDSLQKQRYAEQIPEFWNAEYVAGVTLWGYIYGSTWIDEKDAGGNVITKGISGLIRNGVDRPAMTWLKQYMAANKGVNTTGLLAVKVDTVPQAPYKGAIALPGTVEAENYDVGGQGQSFYDTDTANQGGVYRQDAVDVVSVTGGYAVGYGMAGEWQEYTVNVATAGTFDVDAVVASGLDGASFRLFLDGQAITDTVKIPNGGNWSTYATVTARTASVAAGTHVLRLAHTGNYGNVDKLVFSRKATTGVSRQGMPTGARRFEVRGVNGAFAGSFQAGSLPELGRRMQEAGLVRGLYLVREPGAEALLMPLGK